MKGMNTMRKPLKVFLSGPISSRMETYKAEFADAARIVSEAGHLPLNPATLPIGMEQRDYMRITVDTDMGTQPLRFGGVMAIQTRLPMPEITQITMFGASVELGGRMAITPSRKTMPASTA